MPVLKPSGSDYTSFIKASAQYVPSGTAAKVSKSGSGAMLGPVGLGAIVRASQVGALSSPGSSALFINGITPPRPGPRFPTPPVYTGGPNTWSVSFLVSVPDGYPDGIEYIPTTGNFALANARYSINTLTSAGVITKLAGAAIGTVNGTGASALFNNPRKVCVIPETGVIVVPEKNNIRLVTTSTFAVNSGVATTLAGNAGGGLVNGQGAAASFSGPESVAYDPNTSNVIVADSGNNCLRTITYPGGVVATLATGFSSPQSVTYNPFTGNYVVADSGNNRIVSVTPEGVVTTIAGTGVPGSADGPALTATFSGLTSVKVDPSGNIIALQSDRIRSISRAGVVSTPLINSFGGTPADFAINPTNNNIFVVDIFGLSVWKVV